jgi:hypothetical protein
MQSLPELQRAFAAALIADEEQPLQDCIVGASSLHAAAALAVYRNNVFSNYRKALRDDYTAVLALVGEGFFQGACDAYIRHHPSPSGDLNDFGSVFATFLESWPPAGQLAYLPDVARLEWAMHLAFNAADAPALELASLAQVAPERVPQLRFELHPSAQLIRSPYPVASIWRVSTDAAGADERVDLNAGEDRLLVIRRASGVAIEPLAPGEWAALQALSQRCDLEEAHNRAVAADSAFELGPCLQRHVLAMTIVSFHLPERAQ